MINDLFLALMLVSFICIFVGAIKPALFSRLLKKEITRKNVILIFVGATVVFFVLFGITAPKTQPELKNEQKPVVSEQTGQAKPSQETTPKTDAKTTEAPATKITTTTTQAQTQTPSQNTTPISTTTVSQKNAVKKAKSYLGYTAFSHDGLVDQLVYEQFSYADAVYGADNSGANWNEQAAKKAKSYMDYSAFSRGSLIEQLIHEKFTQAQAEYGATVAGL